jgi:hypothetical protein
VVQYAPTLGAHGFKTVLNLRDSLYPLLLVFRSIPMIICLAIVQQLKAEPLLKDLNQDPLVSILEEARVQPQAFHSSI